MQRRFAFFELLLRSHRPSPTRTRSQIEPISVSRRYASLIRLGKLWSSNGSDYSQSMTKLIALLRGINVIGNNKLPMKELSALLTGMGLRDVQTYIQSGNVVFSCSLKNKATLAAKITAAIKAQHGFAPHVLLLDAAELKKAMAGNPYPDAVAVAQIPAPVLSGRGAAASGLESRWKPSRPAANNSSWQARCSTCTHRMASVLPSSPRGWKSSLGVAATARNWNTVCKLAEMVA